jgi:predicted AAA+ superfamily ATPase
LSISNLVEENWWWKPDFLDFLNELIKKSQEIASDESINYLRIKLTEEMEKRDPEFSEIKKPDTILRIETIWMPSIFFLLRKNLLQDTIGDYVIISLRGPRRIGKTTLIKLLLREIFLESIFRRDTINPLKVVYIRCDRPGMGGVKGLADIIREFLMRRADQVGDVYIFLDEVSSLKNWQIAVKDLYDAGLLTKNKVKLFISGSHSLDVRRGVETLGLRKGVMLEGGNDKLLLPMKFSEYVYYREQLLGKRELREFFTKDRFLEHEKRFQLLKQLIDPSNKIPPDLEKAQTYINELYAYFEDYLLTGGFPLAIRQYLTLGRIHPSVYFDFVDLAVKDAMKWRLNEDTLYSIIWQMLEASGGPFSVVPIKEVSTNSLAEKLGISHNTVKEYLDYLVDAFVLLEVAKLKDVGKRTSPPKSPKKYYFWDPLMFYAFKAISAGYKDPFSLTQNMLNNWKGPVVEMIVAINIAHMILSLEIIQDLRLLKRKMFYYKPKPEKEIDFIIDINGKLIPIEVYSGNKINSEHMKKLVNISKQLKIRGLLIYTGKEIYINERAIIIPAPLFMLLA